MALYTLTILRVSGSQSVTIDAATESDALAAALQQEDGHAFKSPADHRVAILDSNLASKTAGAALASTTNESRAIRLPA